MLRKVLINICIKKDKMIVVQNCFRYSNLNNNTNEIIRKLLHLTDIISYLFELLLKSFLFVTQCETRKPQELKVMQ